MANEELVVTTRPDGAKEHRRKSDGKLHRTDGPAVEHKNGTLEYWQNGRLHRADGPAFVGLNGHVEFWVAGKCVMDGKQTKKMAAAAPPAE